MRVKSDRLVWSQDLPDDLLREFGRVAVRAALLDRMMAMTIRDIDGKSMDELLDVKKYGSARWIRDMLEKTARSRFGNASEAFLKLQGILREAELASRERNDLLHSVWGIDDEENVLGNDERGLQYAAPSVDEVRALADRLENITLKWRDMRFDGWLPQALRDNPPGTPSSV